MDKLPAEMKLFIFSFFEMKDVFKFQLVCKEWNSILKLIRFKDIKIDIECLSKINDNHCANCYIDHCSLTKRIKTSINSLFNDRRFANIKRMKLCFNKYENNGSITLFEQNLDNFVQLENLIINYSLYADFRSSSSSPIEKKLKSNSIKLFEINVFKYYSHQFDLILEMQNLNDLHIITGVSKFDLIYPLSVRHFRSKSFKDLSRDIEKLKNLESLFTEDNHLTSVFSIDLFDSLPSLIEVCYNGDDRYNKNPQLINYMKSNPKLKLYYHHIKIHPDFQFIPHPNPFRLIIPHKLDFGSFEYLNFCIENHSKIEIHQKLSICSKWIDLYYQKYEDKIGLIYELINKRIRINSIIIGPNIMNETHLLQFIEISKPNRLDFRQSNLSNSFFHRLIDLDLSIKWLSIDVTLNKLDDLDFLTSMKKLNTICKLKINVNSNF